MKKPVRLSNGVAAMKLPSPFLLKCMADADARLSSAHFAFETYHDNDGRAICVYAVADEIFVFTQQEASVGPFGKFNTIGIGDVRKLWNYLSSEPRSQPTRPSAIGQSSLNGYNTGVRLFSRHGVIVIVALLCFLPGAMIGAAIGHSIYPDYYLKGIDHDSEKDAVQAIAIGCGIAGSSLAGAALAIATRKRTKSFSQSTALPRGDSQIQPP